MAISSITANQANAMPPVQNTQKTSVVNANEGAQKAISGARSADTVTISQQAQQDAAVVRSLQNIQKTSEAKANNNVREAGDREMLIQ